MRFLLLMYPGQRAEAGVLPDEKAIAKMMKYNEELAKAGILLALDGLHPSTKGTRIRFPGGKPKATDGPFTEAKEVVGGYWMLQVKSREEALEWAKRCPAEAEDMLELRQVFEASDFDVSPELGARAQTLGAELANKTGERLS